MATIIDALVVTLGLDPSGFKKGQAAADSATKKMRADAAQTQKDFDARGKQMAQSIGAVRNQVIGLFAAFTAGRGLKEFISDLTQSDAALGRAAKNIGITADQLSTWQGVAQRTGGSAEGITGSMQGLAQQFQQLYLTGQSGVLPYFRALGVQLDRFVDNRGNVRDMAGLLYSVADAFKSKGLSAAQAQAIGKGLGLDAATINLLYEGREALTAYLAESAKFAASAADTEAAKKRQNAFALLGAASESLGRKLLTAATPAILAISAALTKFSAWAVKHQPLIEAAFIGITAAVVAFAAVLAAPLAGIAVLSLAIASAISAIALLYDDWKVWTEGGKSAFAGFWQFFSDKWKDIQTEIVPILQEFGRQVGNVLTFVKDIFFGTSDDIRRDWSNMSSDLAHDIAGLVKAADRAAPDIQKTLVNALGAFADAAKWILEGVVKDIEWLAHRINAVINAVTGRKIFSEDGSVFDKNPDRPAQYGVTAPFSGETSGSAAKPTSASDIESYIRSAAIKRGIDPDIAVKVAKSEGLNSYVGDRGSSFGPFQLHYGNVASGGMAVGGLGDEFTRKTGLDARDTSTVQAQIDFALDKAAAGGWRPWHGWQGDAFAGIGVSRALVPGPTPDAGLAAGAGVTAAGNTVNNSQSSNSSAQTINVGGVTANVYAQDGQTGKDMADHVGNSIGHSIAAQANTGLTG